MGDALAICLMELNGFQSQDFAKFHPGGSLGKKLYLRVSDLYADNEKPQVLADQTLKEVIVEMTAKRLGITAVVEPDGSLLGIITDGDLRRMLEKNSDIEKVKAGDIMTRNPKTIGSEELAISALDVLRKNEISQLAVTNGRKYEGIIHLHDLIREGLI
jgi:arabinose-5-phosphate isomerase